MFALGPGAILQLTGVMAMSLLSSDRPSSPCPAGFIPPECIHECRDGYYGMSCMSLCSSFCFNASCRPQNGECYQCQIGFYGPMCSEQCRQGYHGANCSIRCPPNCENGRCDPFSGYCLHCVNGYSGSKCDSVQRLQSGQASAVHETSDQTSNHTILYVSIVVIAVTVPVCTVSLWVFLLKKKFKGMYYKRFLQQDKAKIYKLANEVPLLLEASKKFSKDSPSMSKHKLQNYDRDRRHPEASSRLNAHRLRSHTSARNKEGISGRTSPAKYDEEDMKNLNELLQLLKRNSPVQLSQAANYSSELFFKTPNPDSRSPGKSPKKLSDPAHRHEEIQENRGKVKLSQLTSEPFDAQLISRPSNFHNELVTRLVKVAENSDSPKDDPSDSLGKETVAKKKQGFKNRMKIVSTKRSD